MCHDNLVSDVKIRVKALVRKKDAMHPKDPKQMLLSIWLSSYLETIRKCKGYPKK